MRLILQTLEKHVLDPRRMRALGFCMSVAHAQFMADEFTRRGVPALAITGDTPGPQRDEAIRALRELRLNVLFSVDVFSEGVDIPEVDTVLLLCPTESATVFQQQIGRGLRLAEGKACLTVLDFIGLAHRRFRFDLRFAALVPGTRAELRRRIEEGFPFLPSGCVIQLEREAQQAVLENLRTSVVGGGRWLADELRALGDVPLKTFVERAEIEPRDVYGRDRSWTALRRQAGLPVLAGADDRLLGALRRVLHVDSLDRIRFYREVLTGAVVPWDARRTRMWTMLHVLLFSGERPTLEDGLARIRGTPAVRAELLELLDVLEDEVEHLTRPLEVRGMGDVPLEVHGTYALDEILAAFGRLTATDGARIREGVLYDAASGHDLFFVTLQKSEKHYSPTTMYRDYAISPRLFHWESQSMVRAESPTGRRYQAHGRATGTHALLFVRDTVKGAYGTTCAYTFAGPADYVGHEGERPMGVTWALHVELPPALFEVARVAA